MQLNASGKKSEDDFQTSNAPVPGKYHVMIKSVDESFTTHPNAVVVDFEVLAGTVPGQEGKSLYTYFSTSERAQDNLIKLAMITGLLHPDEEADVRFSDAIGRSLIVEAVEEEYQGKKRVKVGYLRMWSVGHADVNSVPISQDYLIAAKQATSTAQEPQPAGATADDDAWANL